METPCQKIVWDLVPAIRASLAIELVKKGQSQATTAKLLGIAPSAVSQYISGKRGYRIEFQGETKELIEKLAQDLIDNKVTDFVARICEICVSARGIEKKCNTGCAEEQTDNKTEDKADDKAKTEDKTDDKAGNQTEDKEDFKENSEE